MSEGIQKARINPKCPKCGHEDMYEDYHFGGNRKPKCMNPACVKPYPIGRVLGLYSGWAESVHYKAATATYPAPSEADRRFIEEKIKELLIVGMGFMNITITPHKQGDEWDGDLITAKHPSPFVNATFVFGRLTRNTFVFENRFGGVRIELGKHGWGEHDQRHSHLRIEAALRKYDAAVHGASEDKGSLHFPKSVQPGKDYDERYNFTTPEYEALTAARTSEKTKTLKESVLRDVRERKDRIRTHYRQIEDLNEEIEKLRASYLKKFGEEMPKVK